MKVIVDRYRFEIVNTGWRGFVEFFLRSLEIDGIEGDECFGKFVKESFRKVFLR